ncbi:hypothetical protein [Bradyrhizobium oligotrophicum]|uniref:hypothetical protein n=1 Tax=Bradyrhizobium oligotrophicum TaxID=44255 RepID=UPI003EBCFE16
MDFRFWEFEHEVIVEAPDSEMKRLDQLAANLADGWGWGIEFDSDTTMRYRFQHIRDALMFAIRCKVKVVSAPERYWSLGKKD